MVVRREVLGDAHVDRATAGATDLTREFQEFITEYAWGGIWTRPGLDRRSRSLITLTALIARGHHEELAMHVRAARTNGLTLEEIKELIMQTAIYCGVPDANTAFRIAQQALADERLLTQSPDHRQLVTLAEALEVDLDHLGEALEVLPSGTETSTASVPSCGSMEMTWPSSQRSTVAPSSSVAGPRLAQWLASCLA